MSEAAGSSSYTVFVDTNCFLQLRDLKDLPWRELFGAVQSIKIVVAPILFEELDKFKTDREGRRRDRARAALRLLEQASAADRFEINLRDKPIRVDLALYNGTHPDWASLPILDPTSADDRLVGTALTHQLTEACCLLSYDTGPVIRGRMAGLKTHRAPEGWLLPDQPSSDQQEVARLKRELDASKATRPTLTLSVHGLNEATAELHVKVPILPPLPPDYVKALMFKLGALHPKAKLKATNLPPNYAGLHWSGERGLTGGQIVQYEDEYRLFIDGAAKAIAKLHDSVNIAVSAFQIKYIIENKSQVTASRLIVEYCLPDDVYFFTKRKKFEKSIYSARLPPPPKPPKPRDPFSVSHGLPSLLSRMREQPRDPTKFYWQDVPEMDDKEISSICEEFRSATVTENAFLLFAQGADQFEGEVGILVSASNMAAPIATRFKVVMTRKRCSWKDVDLRDIVDDWLVDELKNAEE